MKVFISTGEISGDRNAAYLVNKLRSFGWEFKALGGDYLKRQGVDVVGDPSDVSVVGVQEALSKVAKVSYLRRMVLKYAYDSDVFIAVDFPGFNIPLAKVIRAFGKRVIYYIAPQVWAWGKWRVRDLAKLNAVLCVLPFEEEFLRSHGINAYYVGHPVVKKPYRGEVIGTDGPTFGFLPGSRKDEVRRHVPRMLGLAREILKLKPNARFIFSLPEKMAINLENSVVVKGLGRSVIRSSDVLIVASGTATLEAAVEGKPAIVLYLVSELTYWIGRLLVKLPYVSLPNLLLGRKVYPEYIQHIDYKIISKQAVEMLERKEEFAGLSGQLTKILRGRYDEAEIIRKIVQP